MRRPLVGKGRLLLFGSGDFACNLYWQAVTLYLLFFYTDVLGLSPALAGFVYMAGAVWDGIADLLVGIAADRSRQAYRRFVAWGAVPLGLSFPLLFVLPGVEGWPLVALVLGAQMAFRSFYALVNVPYAAWSARISEDSRDRTLVAGARLGFGAAAAMLVALSMSKLGPDPGLGPGGGYGVTAAIFAIVATPLLIVVARRSPEHSVQEQRVEQVSIAASLGALGRNRAFVTLNVAMIAAAIAGAVLNQSVLYYFAHVAGRADGGATALAAMALAGAIAVPAWTAVTLRTGARGMAGGRGIRAGGAGTVRGDRRAGGAVLSGGDAGDAHRIGACRMGDAAEHDRLWRMASGDAGGGDGVRAVSVASESGAGRRGDGAGQLLFGAGIRWRRGAGRCRARRHRLADGGGADNGAGHIGAGDAGQSAGARGPPCGHGATGGAAGTGRRSRRRAGQPDMIQVSRNSPATPSACADGAIHRRKRPGSTVGFRS
jgi:uncharacterized membrane protein